MGVVAEAGEEAVGDLNYVIATTARPREMVKAVLSPESAAATLRLKTRDCLRTGVLFGPERSGLDNDSIVLADAILTAPVSAAFASLSLPQAVLLFAYEWLKSESPSDLGRTTTYDGPAREGISAPDTQPATRAELEKTIMHVGAREVRDLERFLPSLFLISTLAPLLGMFGTVTGMIVTFQAITLYGAGDPKLMAGGISTALVTTVLGLCVAIPTVFLHTLVQSRAKRLTQILQEEAAGMLSERAEKMG